MSWAMDEQQTPKTSLTEKIGLIDSAGSFLGAASAGAVGAGLHAYSGQLLVSAMGVCAVSGLLAWWSHTRADREQHLVETLNAAAAHLESGETIRRIDVADGEANSTLDRVATSFNQIFDALAGVSRRVLGIVNDVQNLPAQINVEMAEIQSSADAQEEAVEETASLLANINSSMRDINERIVGLERSADDSASSILEMGSSIDEVARNAATLHESVETSTSSVHEMGASIRQVAESAGQVERMAEESATSMVEMDRVVHEVSGHAKEAAELTQRVSEGADRGSAAVSDTISDIQQIHMLTTEARDTLGKLVARIDEIGGILGVIGEINDETNLLSLNAAIIAAQAGEQGKAFLVVANHVKTLAKRTASSTQDIGKLVEDVQSESVAAVDAMSAGIEAIEQGVSRSKSAGSALSEILDSSRNAYVRVQGIARATEEQSKSSKLVARAAQETSTQIQQISTAMSEQSTVSERMLKSAETALEMCRHVHRSTEEQRETGRYITESISAITEMIRLIRENAGSHATASESVSDAVMRLLDNAQKSGQHMPKVAVMLEQLSVGAQTIVAELSRFESAQLDFED
jgi:methyl-accepting chemotaxis protein